MRYRKRIASFLVVVASLISCSSLPEYAAPKILAVDPASVGIRDVIEYRTLTRTDFKGEHPPGEFAAYAEQIGAATCCRLRSATETQFMLRAVHSKGGTVRYEATPQELGFCAEMDRKCSWWNPKDLGVPQDYILEHEQIHFALCELEARRLNASIQSSDVQLGVTADTAEEAQRGIQQQLREQLQSGANAFVARSRELDEDTSMGHKPEAQKKWWARVQSELAATGD